MNIPRETDWMLPRVLGALFPVKMRAKVAQSASPPCPGPTRARPDSSAQRNMSQHRTIYRRSAQGDGRGTTDLRVRAAGCGAGEEEKVPWWRRVPYGTALPLLLSHTHIPRIWIRHEINMWIKRQKFLRGGVASRVWSSRNNRDPSSARQQ